MTWEFEAHWKQWKKSAAYIAGHKANLNQTKPAHTLNVEVAKYEMKVIKKPVSSR